MSKMNKTYINLLCVLILGLLAVKVMVPLMSISTSSFIGNHNHELTDTHTPFISGFSANPKVSFTPTDTITFESGKSYPVITREISLFVPDKNIPDWVRIASGLSYLASALVMLFGFYEFIRFIVNINRSRIFVRDNIRRLLLFGWALIACAAIMVIAGVAESSLVGSLKAVYAGRSLHAVWDFPWSTLLIGLVALLMARVWSRGISLREDHDLTI